MTDYVTCFLRNGNFKIKKKTDFKEKHWVFNSHTWIFLNSIQLSKIPENM